MKRRKPKPIPAGIMEATLEELFAPDRPWTPAEVMAEMDRRQGNSGGYSYRLSNVK